MIWQIATEVHSASIALIRVCLVICLNYYYFFSIGELLINWSTNKSKNPIQDIFSGADRLYQELWRFLYNLTAVWWEASGASGSRNLIHASLQPLSMHVCHNLIWNCNLIEKLFVCVWGWGMGVPNRPDQGLCVCATGLARKVDSLLL